MKKLRSLLAFVSILISGCGLSFNRYNTDQVIKRIKTPEDAFSYLQKHVAYIPDPEDSEGNADNWSSLEQTLEIGAGDCDDFAIASAAMLKDNGYLPLLMILDGDPLLFNKQHVVHLIRRGNFYGCVGINKDDSRPVPIYSTISELIDSLTPLHNYKRYTTINLENNGVDYTRGGKNLRHGVLPRFSDIKWTDVAGTN